MRLISTTTRRVIVLVATVAVSLGVSLSLAPNAHAASQTLTYGSRGSSVVQLQRALDKNRLGDMFANGSTYTGGFYRVTQTGLKRWEKAAGQKVDGKITIGSTEWKKLMGEQKSSVPKVTTKKSVSTKTPTKTTSSKGIHLDSRCKIKGKALCASKSDRKLYYVVNGQVVKTLDARFGRSGLGTREGVFHVFRKVKDDWSYTYHVPMKYSMYFSRGQAVHYSAEFRQIGYSVPGSHGCVNTRDRDATAWLFSHVPVGTRVVVYH